MPKIKTVPIDYMKAWQFKPRKSGLFNAPKGRECDRCKRLGIPCKVAPFKITRKDGVFRRNPCLECERHVEYCNASEYYRDNVIISSRHEHAQRMKRLEKWNRKAYKHRQRVAAKAAKSAQKSAKEVAEAKMLPEDEGDVFKKEHVLDLLEQLLEEHRDCAGAIEAADSTETTLSQILESIAAIENSVSLLGNDVVKLSDRVDLLKNTVDRSRSRAETSARSSANRQERMESELVNLRRDFSTLVETFNSKQELSSDMESDDWMPAHLREKYGSTSPVPAPVSSDDDEYELVKSGNGQIQFEEDAKMVTPDSGIAQVEVSPINAAAGSNEGHAPKTPASKDMHLVADSSSDLSESSDSDQLDSSDSNEHEPDALPAQVEDGAIGTTEPECPLSAPIDLATISSAVHSRFASPKEQRTVDISPEEEEVNGPGKGHDVEMGEEEAAEDEVEDDAEEESLKLFF